MAANILNSERAVEASVHVVRAFVQLRNLAFTHKEIGAELDKLKSRSGTQLAAPENALALPSVENLSYHAEHVFRG